MPKYGPMGPPVARARPARAHVVASEHARAMERHRAAVAFEQRHEGAVSSPEKSAYAFQPPPWVESASPPRSGTQARAFGRGTPALTHAQLDAALAVADALRADGLSDDAERVLRTVLKTDPGNARAAEGLRFAGAVPSGVSASRLSGGSEDTPVARGRGRARVPRDEHPGALGAYGVPKPSAEKATRAAKDDVSVEPPARDFVVRLDLRYADDGARRKATNDDANSVDREDGDGPSSATAGPLWSASVERPLLFDRLPEPPRAKVPGKPPPPVTRADLDAELFAKRERVARERALERREAGERAPGGRAGRAGKGGARVRAQGRAACSGERGQSARARGARGGGARRRRGGGDGERRGRGGGRAGETHGQKTAWGAGKETFAVCRGTMMSSRLVRNM